MAPTNVSDSPRLSLDEVLAGDRAKLIALDKKRRDFARQKKPHEQVDQQLAASLAQARERYRSRQLRHAVIAHPVFDDALPIAERRAEIAALIHHHQVVIVCGETGSGKTTQLPKICLELSFTCQTNS